VADPDRRRILHEDGNESHRLRVEHDRARLYVELSGEDGTGPWMANSWPCQSDLAPA